ncbi:hypothetical protein [Cryobacterium sp. Hh7]|nr:hypothetical protein [Cryobacterium sp. Hh7]
MKSKAERRATFERREILRKAKYAEALAQIAKARVVTITSMQRRWWKP